MARIYLDACCFSRPFDSHHVERNRLEGEAVLSILQDAVAGKHLLVVSDVVEAEIGQIADADRRVVTLALLASRQEYVRAHEREFARADEVVALGFKAVDALHIACAEGTGVDVVLTIDDRMLRSVRRNAGSIRVRVVNPLDWVRESEHDDDQRREHDE